MTTFAKNLRRIRNERSISQRQLADYLNVAPQSVSKWEKGISEPSLSNLPLMATFFDCRMEDFFSANDQSEGAGSMVARFLAEHSKAARGDQSWRDAAVYAVAHKEERDVTEIFLNRIDNYKTVNVKIIRALLGCSEGEAKQILADLVELDLLEELDIEDCYFVVHKEIPNVIGLFKMHVVYVLAMERRNAGKPVFEGEEMERAINELCEDPIDNGKEEEQ